MDENREVVNFSEVLTALADTDTPFPPRLLRGFSDMSYRSLKELLLVWNTIPDARKVGVLEDLDDLLEKDTLVNFDDLAKVVLCDSNPKVRVTALGLLWENEEPRLVSTLINLLNDDPDEAVRTLAASLLGRFVLLGELDSISENLKNEIIDNLLQTSVGAELSQVKRRALESLGYSSHPDVPGLIRNAYETEDIPWVASALCAMGRSADEQWESHVLAQLNSPDTEVQFEAVRAAGELELASAREPLLSLLDEEIEDREVKFAVIWALSQIGGEDIKEKFDELLTDAIDEEEIEWIEKAIENLELSASQGFDMLDFSPDDESNEPDFDEDEDDPDGEFSDEDFDEDETDDL